MEEGEEEENEEGRRKRWSTRRRPVRKDCLHDLGFRPQGVPGPNVRLAS